jgi:spore germination protein YaaH
MAYEEHGGLLGPGPVAGIDWVEAVTRGSAAGIHPKKVYLGVPFYYDEWSTKQSPDAGGWRDLLESAAKSDVGLQWDFTTASAYLRWTDSGVEHVAWLEEGASLRAKVRLAKSLGVRGISTWRLALEDPAFWDLFPARR